MSDYFISKYVFVTLLVIGWVLNVLKLLSPVPGGAPWTLEDIIRLAGVPVVPLGAFLGFL